MPEPEYDYSYAEEQARCYWREIGMRDSWRLIMESINMGPEEDLPRPGDNEEGP